MRSRQGAAGAFVQPKARDRVFGALVKPVAGHWCRQANEIRFWGVEESIADSLIKRMMTCLDCGFCIMVECFRFRRFDRGSKTLHMGPCIGCGKCLRLKFCMGWRHRFWRRVIWPHDGKACAEVT